MPIRTWERVSAASGLVFVALLIAARVIVPAPVYPEIQAGGLVRSYYLQNEGRLHAQGVLLGLACLVALVFLGVVHRTLRRESELPWLAPVVLASGATLIGLTLASSAALWALVDFRQAEVIGATNGNAGGALALYYLYRNLGEFATYVQVALLVAASAAALHTSIFPAWLGWSGLGLAAVMLVELVVRSIDLGDLPDYGFLAWLAALSVLLLTEARAASPAQPVG
jgi:hypothetical protein